MRVDSHVHLWDLASRAQPWTAEFPVLQRSFFVEDLRDRLAESGFDGAVLVQSIDDIAETVELLGLADHEPAVLGVVGWIDLAGDVRGQVALLRDGPGGATLVGVRHQIQNEIDPVWMGRADIRSGLQDLADLGLAFDLIVRPYQLAGAADLARAVGPELRLVLDHGGKPPITATDPAALTAWAEQIGELAALPNVSVKLSGLVTEAAWRSWQPADIAPVIEVLLTAFGPKRCMFGSDWPVCLLAAEYPAVVQLVETGMTDMNDAERQHVWGATAAQWYHL